MWNVIEYDQFMEATLIFNVYNPFRYLRELFNVSDQIITLIKYKKSLNLCEIHN